MLLLSKQYLHIYNINTVFAWMTSQTFEGEGSEELAAVEKNTNSVLTRIG